MNETTFCKLDIKSKLTKAFCIFAVIFWVLSAVASFLIFDVEYDSRWFWGYECDEPEHDCGEIEIRIFDERVYSSKWHDGNGVDSFDCREGEFEGSTLGYYEVRSNGSVVTSESEFDGEGVALSVAVIAVFVAVPFAIRGMHKFVAKRCELVLTDKQLNGTLKFPFSTQKIQIPTEKIDNIYTSDSLVDALRGGKTLAIRSASGIIKFHYVYNADEFVDVAMKQVEAIRNNGAAEVKAEAPKAEAAGTSSAIEDVKKLKELLDSGILTPEEFEAKKKELLGL